MVFFMIMPAIFGAFGNFLLPTQLGVHDVAFPRLNSAAFWFLPGGLVMLLQLVCVDRRYQRMNAFNIRELQATLKRSYFTDLLNAKDQREVLDGSMLGLRYKMNASAASEYDTHLFHACGPTTTPKLRGGLLSPLQSQSLHYPTYNGYLTGYSFLPQPSTPHALIPSAYRDLNLSSATAALIDSLDMSTRVTTPLFYNTTYRLQFTATPTLAFSAPTQLSYGLSTSFGPSHPSNTTRLGAAFDSERLSRAGLSELSQFSGSEDGFGGRYSRFMDASIDYAYRSGNYFGRWNGFFTSSMLVSSIEITRKIRKAPWF
jgi:hypothetical protein